MPENRDLVPNDRGEIPAENAPPPRASLTESAAEDGTGFRELVPHLKAPFPADRHPALVYLASLSLGSRRAMRQALNMVAFMLTGGRKAGDGEAADVNADAALLPWHLVRYQHTQAVRAALAEKYAPRSASKILSAMRGVLKECWRLGYTDAETYQRAVDVRDVRGEDLPSGRALADGELRALIDTCCNDPSPAGARDAALFAVIFGGGLRRAEAVGLDVADYASEEGALRVRRGKGNYSRLVPLPDGACAAIEEWLLVRGREEGPLLGPVLKNGKLVPRRMTPEAVFKRTWKRALEAGIRRFSPHDARRTFITGLLSAGADVVTVQRLAGHARVETTAGYDRRGEVAKKRAVGMWRFPFRGRG